MAASAAVASGSAHMAELRVSASIIWWFSRRVGLSFGAFAAMQWLDSPYYEASLATDLQEYLIWEDQVSGNPYTEDPNESDWGEVLRAIWAAGPGLEFREAPETN